MERARDRLLLDTGILVARLGLGLVLVAYGWQKLFDWGIPMTAEIMSAGGVPLANVTAYIATFVELIAGLALILGVAVTTAGIGAAVLMTGAVVFVNIGSGIYTADGGFAFPLAVGVAALLVAATGAGRFSLDHVMIRPARNRLDARRADRQPAG
ncbi:DoxX family protein [Hoyosella sp. YIM 151337]|uniref:DoxX family protein n=1 Tax=Hoyosella sp. YIM 151337 TaxID=2992742 RepID=UPI0022361864|nr:DoxX family protein [Hoyosella sp. YIM 151337]MCW4353003.1 DoxX family protein [Hoyosella sp. YIM 151337]